MSAMVVDTTFQKFMDDLHQEHGRIKTAYEVLRDMRATASDEMVLREARKLLAERLIAVRGDLDALNEKLRGAYR